jgi:hypothetical protein
LLDTPIATLTETYKAKCAGIETKNLGFDDCKQIDYARNCVYAAHGLVYKKPRWKKLFETKPWYEPNAGITAKQIVLGDIEHANIHELYMRGKACKKNLKISGADYERIKAWFAALPQPAMPAQLFTGEDPEDGDETDVVGVDGKTFVTFLTDASRKIKTLATSGKDTVAQYLQPDDVAAQPKLLAKLKLTDPTKLRWIRLDVELGPGSEAGFTAGLVMQFVYDDNDQLVAITAVHYETE